MKQLWHLLHLKNIKYLVFGGLTTLVNYVVFGAAVKALGISATLYANALAFVLATAFAFVANKQFVFESRDWSWRVLWKEGFSFIAARLLSFFLEQGGLYFCIRFIDLGETGVILLKIVLSIIVVLLNYFFSKWFIFKEK